MIEIIEFSSENRSFIKDLNYEWLQKYFAIEPSDEKQLSDPEKEIIDKGGYIFYAEIEGKIAGTVSLLKQQEVVYELGKMATTESSRGKGIGNALIQHCIHFAKGLNAKKLILYSNTKLQAAIHLYKKYGFEEVPLENSHYKRSDIKMEKLL
jgi:ribosomal protein S18 acetylase RimI-like enzyme